MSLSNSQKSRIKKILDEGKGNNYDGPLTFGDNFIFWMASIPFWFFSSCEQSYYDTVFHIEIFIGIPVILLVLMIIFYFKDRDDILMALSFFPAIIAFIFSILNLFSKLGWFHYFFPIFVENTSLF